jgi:dTDP-4-amino-4,6-dideoxygalactose transaminase
MKTLNEAGIGATFHYVPLHCSPAGRRYGRPGSALSNTEDCAGQILRLPLFPSLTEEQQDRVCTILAAAVSDW